MITRVCYCIAMAISGCAVMCLLDYQHYEMYLGEIIGSVAVGGLVLVSNWLTRII
jgi:hypothetical protein